MLRKNKFEYEANPKAYSHICWSMGLYSMYTDNPKSGLLWKGVTIDRFNIRRFLIYIALKSPAKQMILHKYGLSH